MNRSFIILLVILLPMAVFGQKDQPTSAEKPLASPDNGKHVLPAEKNQSSQVEYQLDQYGVRSETQSASQSSPIGWWSIAQMLLALALVGAFMKLVLPRVLKNISTARFGTTDSGGILVLESRVLGNASLHLITARDKVLLIGLTQTQCNLIMDLTQSDKEVRPNESSADFETVLKQAKPKGTAVEAENETVKSSVEDAIDRLKKMTE